MKTHATAPLLEFALCCLISFTPSRAQTPAPPGRLHITSTPDRQPIKVNGATRQEVTDVTLVVSAGKYTIQVGTCQPQDISVSSGETKEIHCPWN